MRAIDRATSERFGVSSITLMEKAGLASPVSSSPITRKRAHRHLSAAKATTAEMDLPWPASSSKRGVLARSCCCVIPKKLRGDTAVMFQKLVQTLRPLKNAPLIVRDASGLDSSDAAEIFAADGNCGLQFSAQDFVRRSARSMRRRSAKMNAASAPVVAVDIPSGAGCRRHAARVMFR